MPLIDDEAQDIALQKLQDLLDLESGLSDWEMGFIENISKWDNNFTDKQAACLDKIWKKLCGKKGEPVARKQEPVEEDLPDEAFQDADPADLQDGEEIPF